MEQVETLSKSEHWREIVSKFEQSGLSQSEFSRQEGLVKSRLSYWLAKFRTTSKRQSQFVELEPKPKVKPSVELEFSSGMVLRIGV